MAVVLAVLSGGGRRMCAAQAWRAMEVGVASGRVRQLGVSNLKSLEQLQRLHADAVVKPSVVQQRFHGATQFEYPMREWFVECPRFSTAFAAKSYRTRLPFDGSDCASAKSLPPLPPCSLVPPLILTRAFCLSLQVQQCRCHFPVFLDTNSQ
eukprot:SAG31_NODE_4143_length_3535_cov_2.664726_4_plen_152_part_00